MTLAETLGGMVTAPRKTIETLAERRTSEAFFFVVLVANVMGWLRFRPESANALSVSSFVIATVFDWCLLSLTLYYLARLEKRQIKASAAFTVMGWSFTPLLFTAPVYCFKTAVGAFFPLLAVMPVLWCFALIFISFKSTLKISTARLILLAIMLPPALFTVYAFWLGLALLSSVPSIAAILQLAR